MVQVRVKTRGMDFDQIAKDLEQDVTKLKRNTLTSIAEVIAQTSPVDSGEYARNHEVSLRSGSFAATKTRDDNLPRRSRGQTVNEQAARKEGLDNMISGINRVVDGESSNFVFRNPMAYSSLVETEHAVYSRARREVVEILKAEAAKLRTR